MMLDVPDQAHPDQADDAVAEDGDDDAGPPRSPQRHGRDDERADGAGGEPDVERPTGLDRPGPAAPAQEHEQAGRHEDADQLSGHGRNHRPAGTNPPLREAAHEAYPPSTGMYCIGIRAKKAPEIGVHQRPSSKAGRP